MLSQLTSLLGLGPKLQSATPSTAAPAGENFAEVFARTEGNFNEASDETVDPIPKAPVEDLPEAGEAADQALDDWGLPPAVDDCPEIMTDDWKRSNATTSDLLSTIAPVSVQSAAQTSTNKRAATLQDHASVAIRTTPPIDEHAGTPSGSLQSGKLYDPAGRIANRHATTLSTSETVGGLTVGATVSDRPNLSAVPTSTVVSGIAHGSETDLTLFPKSEMAPEEAPHRALTTDAVAVGQGGRQARPAENSPVLTVGPQKPSRGAPHIPFVSEGEMPARTPGQPPPPAEIARQSSTTVPNRQSSTLTQAEIRTSVQAVGKGERGAEAQKSAPNVATEATTDVSGFAARPTRAFEPVQKVSRKSIAGIESIHPAAESKSVNASADIFVRPTSVHRQSMTPETPPDTSYAPPGQLTQDAKKTLPIPLRDIRGETETRRGPKPLPIFEAGSLSSTPQSKTARPVVPVTAEIAASNVLRAGQTTETGLNAQVTVTSRQPLDVPRAWARHQQLLEEASTALQTDSTRVRAELPTGQSVMTKSALPLSDSNGNQTTAQLLDHRFAQPMTTQSAPERSLPNLNFPVQSTPAVAQNPEGAPFGAESATLRPTLGDVQVLRSGFPSNQVPLAEPAAGIGLSPLAARSETFGAAVPTFVSSRRAQVGEHITREPRMGLDRSPEVSVATTTTPMTPIPQSATPTISAQTGFRPQAVVGNSIIGTRDEIPDDPNAEFGSDFGLGGGARSYSAAATVPHASPPQPPHRSDTAAIIRQVVDGLSRIGDGTIELRLSPDELGRVRMYLVSGEHGLMVNIQADRPETLDLMRRNVDELARNLADAGYEGAGFSFGDSPQERRANDTPQQSLDYLEPDPVPDQPPTIAASTGIDIRI